VAGVVYTISPKRYSITLLFSRTRLDETWWGVPPLVAERVPDAPITLTHVDGQTTAAMGKSIAGHHSHTIQPSATIVKTL